MITTIRGLEWEPVLGGYGSDLFAAVAEGMAPFQLKMVDIQMDLELDFNRYRVAAGAVLLSGYTIGYNHAIDAWDLGRDPDLELRKAAEVLFRAFRHRANIREIPSNITLGEY